MPFVKLDCGILDSTLWIERECREVFITALLMAEPIELREPAQGIKVQKIEPSGFIVPAGWYGIVNAAGPGIIRRCGIDQTIGMAALERLGDPDPGSRSHKFDGRRLIRIDGGYIVLNYFNYRDRDYTGSERAKRYRERQKSAQVASTSHRDAVTSHRDAVTSHRDVTQAEAEAYIPPRAAREAPPLDAKPEKKSKPRRSTPKTQLPADFKISERVTAWATGKGFADIDRHFEHFVSKARAKGYTYADWDEGFMGAVREDWAQLRSPGEKSTGTDPPLFADAWRSYPLRDGNNPVIEAREAWAARVTEGCDPKEMLAGTLRYAEWCRANGKIGTGYVLQGGTFYGDTRPFEQSFVIAPDESKPIVDQRCVFIDPETGLRCEESMNVKILTLDSNGGGKHVFGCCHKHYYPAVTVGRELHPAPELVEIVTRFKEYIRCSPS